MLTLALARADASFLLPQDPLCRLGEIFRDEVGRRGPLRCVPGQFTFAVACTHEDASRTGIPREFHVAIAIANHERALQIESVLQRCAVQHAGSWLAAAAVFGGGGRDIIDRVALCAL